MLSPPSQVRRAPHEQCYPAQRQEGSHAKRRDPHEQLHGELAHTLVHHPERVRRARTRPPVIRHAGLKCLAGEILQGKWSVTHDKSDKIWRKRNPERMSTLIT